MQHRLAQARWREGATTGVVHTWVVVGAGADVGAVNREEGDAEHSGTPSIVE
jgi:hypothetical protein